jgi:hypothetical protein
MDSTLPIDLEELAEELSQQEEEEKEKDEEPPLNHMKTSDIQNILSDMEILNDEPCDNDHNRERSAKVKKDSNGIHWLLF